MSSKDTGVFHDMRVDHLKLYVTNLTQSAAYFAGAYGFTAPTVPNGRTAMLEANRIRFELVQPTAGDRAASTFTERHGDGVGDIALCVLDPAAAFHEAVRRGARPICAPADHGGGVTATIAGFADVTHTFVKGTDTPCPPLPHAAPHGGSPSQQHPGLIEVDHLAVCVQPGELEPLAAFYERVFDFETTFTEHIVVGTQAIRTTAVQSRSGRVTLTLIEPDTTRDPGQIDRFLHDHGGAGVQHVAFSTGSIVDTVRSLTRGGVNFAHTPATYYDLLTRRLTPVRYTADRLKELSILVDVDQGGQLFQIFSKSVHPLNTLFFEIIERQGGRTFGGGNIAALYESVRLEESAAGLRRGSHRS
ncbi:4-hydroxyphenylpyruvate dioxygenase [Streptomyces albidochromogenes]|uniref:4-hydroxyphenylpyruvate dioxygenase n=1 Tax=Streptomyces albidochromogenes TaxID=329524 RepID=A0ABW6FMW5_9ACTN